MTFNDDYDFAPTNGVAIKILFFLSEFWLNFPGYRNKFLCFSSCHWETKIQIGNRHIKLIFQFTKPLARACSTTCSPRRLHFTMTIFELFCGRCRLRKRQSKIRTWPGLRSPTTVASEAHSNRDASRAFLLLFPVQFTIIFKLRISRIVDIMIRNLMQNFIEQGICFLDLHQSFLRKPFIGLCSLVSLSASMQTGAFVSMNPWELKWHSIMRA